MTNLQKHKLGGDPVVPLLLEVDGKVEALPQLNGRGGGRRVDGVGAGTRAGHARRVQGGLGLEGHLLLRDRVTALFK